MPFVLRYAGKFCLLSFAILIGSVLCGKAPARFQDSAGQKTSRKDPSKKNTGKKSRGKPSLPVTAEREAAALTFVRQYHKELLGPLSRLKKKRVNKYRRAIRQLFNTSERLAQWRLRDPDRYELELESWKLKSQLQFLAARSAMSSSDVREHQLREKLAQQIEIQIQISKLQRRRLQERLQKLDDVITKAEQSRTELVEKKMNQLKRGVEKSRRQRSKTKEAGKSRKKSPKNTLKESLRDK